MELSKGGTPSPLLPTEPPRFVKAIAPPEKASLSINVAMPEITTSCLEEFPTDKPARPPLSPLALAPEVPEDSSLLKPGVLR